MLVARQYVLAGYESPPKIWVMAKLELLWQMKRIFPQDLQTSVALAINSVNE